MLICAYTTMVITFIYSMFKMRRSLHMIQQNLYNENNRYLKWISKNRKEITRNIDLFGILFCFCFAWTYNTYLSFYFLAVLILLYVVVTIKIFKDRKNEQDKKPLVVTARVKRLIVTTVILYLLPCILGIIFMNHFNDCNFILSIMAVLSYYIVYLANVINKPIERYIYHGFEKKAKQKLASMPDLKIIGITGSYGKTSCKNILNDVLSEKFNTLATPRSVNTFNGITMTINNNLSKFEDCFVVEMGAYVKGEINGLCKLANPKYAIITRIGTAHLESFGSEENIQKGKMELVEYLPSDGVAVLNRDDPKQKDYVISKKDHCKVVWIGIDTKDEVDVKASNIKCNKDGTTFDCTFKGDKKKYSFKTKLLGFHNVYNIISALALGREFGIEISKLQQAVKKIKPIEHRLEIKKFNKFYQIDDAYNSNPTGAVAALDVLEMMDGYKVVITPGMIELGNKQDYYNKNFGKQIAAVADKVILVGEKQTEPILKGLKESKYDEKNITIINDVKEAYDILNEMKVKKDIYALFENDLPDSYVEKK